MAPKKPVGDRFTKDSPEFKKMLEMLLSGEVKATDQPASVRSKYPDIFGKFTASQFRSQWHNAKAMAKRECILL
jgi:hypothetical protein